MDSAKLVMKHTIHAIGLRALYFYLVPSSVGCGFTPLPLLTLYPFSRYKRNIKHGCSMIPLTGKMITNLDFLCFMKIL